MGALEPYVLSFCFSCGIFKDCAIERIFNISHSRVLRIGTFTLTVLKELFVVGLVGLINECILCIVVLQEIGSPFLMSDCKCIMQVIHLAFAETFCSNFPHRLI